MSDRRWKATNERREGAVTHEKRQNASPVVAPPAEREAEAIQEATSRVVARRKRIAVVAAHGTWQSGLCGYWPFSTSRIARLKPVLMHRC